MKLRNGNPRTNRGDPRAERPEDIQRKNTQTSREQTTQIEEVCVTNTHSRQRRTHYPRRGLVYHHNQREARTTRRYRHVD